MWFAVLALAGVAAAEGQCACTGAQVYNPVIRQCVDDVSGMPVNWTGSTFLFDMFEYQNCLANTAWNSHMSNGYQRVREDDQCSCIASNRIDLDTDTNTAVGYSWDYSTQKCKSGILKYTGATPTSNEIDVKECAFKLVNNYPDSFSHCGSLNMCHCAQTNRLLIDAVAANPTHNASGNAVNVEGTSYRQCGWSFTQNSCVPQTEKYSGLLLFLRANIFYANAICVQLGYFVDQPGRTPNVTTSNYVPPPYVSPTIAICAAKATSKCTCNEDPRCFMNSNLDCVPHLVDDAEVNRTASNVTDELVSELCGDTYCNTLANACDCYETPHSTGDVCGWDKINGICGASITSNIVDMYQAHCCDAFKSPCECKVGRLPWAGYADFNNTCGWDHAEGVCRLSAITTASEIVGHGCAAPGACILVDLESNCNTTECDWLDGRHSCVAK